MPRNGSGTYNLSDTITDGTTASAAELQAILNDIATALTGSVASDGQKTLTGPLKLANGSAAAPALAFGGDSDSGLYWISANTLGIAIGGTLVCTIDSGGFNLASGLSYEVNASNVTESLIPSGTAMLFVQTTAPTGWTKSTDHNNKALRVVSGTASSGGTVDFTTAFASKSVAGTVGGTALTEANLPSHYHLQYVNGDANGGSTVTGTHSPMVSDQNSGNNSYKINTSGSTSATLGRTSTVGSGTTHTHTFTGTAINLAVKYVDTIIATKD